MILNLLGTGGYHPSELRHTACMMLPEVGVVLDAGTALFRVRDHLITKHLDIFLTHGHLDHVIGLTFLYDVLWEKPCDRVTIHASAETIEAITEHLYSPKLFPVKPPWEFKELEANVPLPGGGTLTHFPLKHPGGSLGFRLDWPQHSMAYVTDTTAKEGAAYEEHLKELQLLVHECYFDDSLQEHAELTGHSCTTAVAELAQRVKPEKLILVHVNPLDSMADPIGLPLAKSLYPATEMASDGMEVEF